MAALGRSYALAGERANARNVARQFERLAEHEHVWPTDAAFLYAALGEKDRAFYWLDKAVQEKDGWLFLINVDPRLNSLRSDPRFSAIASKVGLPAVQQCASRPAAAVLFRPQCPGRINRRRALCGNDAGQKCAPHQGDDRS